MVDKLTPVEAEVLELPDRPNQAEEPEDSYGTASMPKPKKNYVGLWICFGLVVIALCTFSVFAAVFSVRFSKTPDGKWTIQNRSEGAETPGEDPIRELPVPETAADNAEERALPGDAVDLDLEQNQSGQAWIDPAALYESVSPSVVLLKMNSYSGNYFDTGIIITEDGFILSAMNEKNVPFSIEAVMPDGSELLAECVSMDRTTGICLLKVESSGLTPARFDFESSLRVGQKIYCICNPFGDAMINVLDEGMLASVREVELNGVSFQMMETSADLQDSGYGIPIIDENGSIIGMTTAIGRWFFSSGQDPCFCVSASDLKQTLDRMSSKAVKEEVSFGIKVEEVPDYYQIMFGFPGTLWISEISEDSPMYRSLKVCDVITAVNDLPVRTVEDYQTAVKQASQRGSVCLTIYRDGVFYYATIPVRRT